MKTERGVKEEEVFSIVFFLVYIHYLWYSRCSDIFPLYTFGNDVKKDSVLSYNLVIYRSMNSFGWKNHNFPQETHLRNFHRTVLFFSLQIVNHIFLQHIAVWISIRHSSLIVSKSLQIKFNPLLISITAFNWLNSINIIPNTISWQHNL